MKRIIVLVLLAILGLTGLGCVAVSKYVTPAPKASEAALEYGYKAGVLDPNSYRGYANLEKAERLELALESAYNIYTLGLEHATEKHELDYGILAKVAAANTKTGKERETALFSEKGLIPLIAGLAGFGGFTGLIGLMRKRPGDLTPADLQTATAQAGIDLGDKERQMHELVVGVSEFMATYDKSTVPGGALRSALEKATNTDTKQTVAALKAV